MQSHTEGWMFVLLVREKEQKGKNGRCFHNEYPPGLISRSLGMLSDLTAFGKSLLWCIDLFKHICTAEFLEDVILAINTTKSQTLNKLIPHFILKTSMRHLWFTHITSTIGKHCCLQASCSKFLVDISNNSNCSSFRPREYKQDRLFKKWVFRITILLTISVQINMWITDAWRNRRQKKGCIIGKTQSYSEISLGGKLCLPLCHSIWEPWPLVVSALDAA